MDVWLGFGEELHSTAKYVNRRVKFLQTSKGAFGQWEVFYVPQTPYVNLSLGRGKERWIVGIGSVAES